MNGLQFAEWLPDLLEGLKVTMAASLISIVTSTVLGAVVAIFVAYDNKIVTGILRVFVSIFRNTPLLVIMFFIFYGLPLINVVWPPLVCGVLAITLNESAFVAEILRGSILNIPQGDIEAAVSLGLKKWQVSSKIIFPLAMRNSVPMLVGQSSVIVKDTSLFSLIMI
ncbi:MAG: amino acid ABC transporter permease, partial [Mogibacterium sp.]|nr:amino acid ABC transporter permease [Mogibacterium sp.]